MALILLLHVAVSCNIKNISCLSSVHLICEKNSFNVPVAYDTSDYLHLTG